MPAPGKTSILCHLANVAEVNKGVVDKIETTPTIAVQMVEFRWRGVKWVAWDMSGQGACIELNVRHLEVGDVLHSW